MAPLKEHCPRDSLIETPEECKIAHRKFDHAVNTYAGELKDKKKDYPAGCFCTSYLEEKYNCTQTKFNDILVTSGKIDVGAGICRIKGNKMNITHWIHE